MNNIKRNKSIFLVSSIVSLLVLAGSIFWVNSFEKEMKELNYLPMGTFKIISQEESNAGNGRVLTLKTIINPDSSISDTKLLIDSVTEYAKNIDKFDFFVMEFYGNPKAVKADDSMLKVIYSPYTSLKWNKDIEEKNYDEYLYTYLHTSEKYTELKN